MALQLLKPEDDDDGAPVSPTPDSGQDEPRGPVRGDDTEGEGEGADEKEDLDEDSGQEEIDSKPSRTRSRDYERIDTENRELRERLNRLEQQRREPPPEREPSDDEKALWTTQQHIQYELGKSEKRNQQLWQSVQFQTAESGDKAGWTSYCATDARARRMTQDVEKRLQDLRNQGQWGWSRGQVYTIMVGERTIQQGRKAAEEQERQGQRRIARQKTSGSSPAGDQRKNERGNLTPQEERNKRLKESGFFG